MSACISDEIEIHFVMIHYTQSKIIERYCFERPEIENLLHLSKMIPFHTTAIWLNYAKQKIELDREKKKTHHNLDTELELSQNVRDHKQSGFHSRYYNEPVVNLPESNKHSESHYRLVN